MPEPFPFAKYFGEIRILADLQLGDAKPYADRPPVDPEGKELLLYLGCNVLRTAHLAVTAVEILKALGFDFNTVGGPAYCCGIIHHRAGHHDASRAYSASTLRHFAAYEPRHVIMWCPSCVEHYDGVVTTEHDVAFPYEHYTAFVRRHLHRAGPLRPIRRRVAMHYHTGHPTQDLDAESARAILEAIPGVEYVHVPNPAELGRHCSPNYINRVGRPRWEACVDEIAEAAAAAGADTLATIYHSCHREICDREGRYPLEVVNYATLLAEAMGLETPADWHKRHRLTGDPAAAFAEVREQTLARGLDPERVQEVLAKAFTPACEARPAVPELPTPS
jgi:Fe-S oxidoreductase